MNLIEDNHIFIRGKAFVQSPVVDSEPQQLILNLAHNRDGVLLAVVRELFPVIKNNKRYGLLRFVELFSDSVVVRIIDKEEYIALVGRRAVYSVMASVKIGFDIVAVHNVVKRSRAQINRDIVVYGISAHTELLFKPQVAPENIAELSDYDNRHFEPLKIALVNIGYVRYRSRYGFVDILLEPYSRDNNDNNRENSKRRLNA